MLAQQVITNISGVKVLEVVEGRSIEIIGVAKAQALTQCPHCKSSCFRIKSSRQRELKHGLWGQKLVFLKIMIPKFLCKICGRYFTLQVPGLLPRRRSTEQFRKDVFRLHWGGLTQVDVSRSHGISGSTVERGYQDFVAYRVKELAGRQCPTVMGIDEHFFSRKQGFATTFVDLRNHKVFDVVLGRSEKSLAGHLRRLKGRHKVKVLVMDLSETYRSIIQKYFPSVMIVADRFHVVSLLNQHFLKVWSTLDPEGRKNRGLLSLVRRHESNLKPDQVLKLQEYFARTPGLEALYRFKQDLMQLLLQDLMQLLLKKRQKREEAKVLIPQMLWHLNECLQRPWQPMKTFGETRKSWLEPIMRMWRFTKNNGITARVS